MELASLRGSALVTGSQPRLHIDARVSRPEDGGGYVEPGYVEPGYFEEGSPTQPGPWLRIALSLTAGLAEAIRGESALFPSRRGQVVGPMLIWADGFPIPHAYILPETWVEEDDEGVQTFGFALPRRGVRSLNGVANDPGEALRPWMASDVVGGGSPMDNFGPPMVGSQIDIDGIYITSDGPRRIRLVTGGLIDNASLEEGGTVRRYSGVGKLARYERARGQYLMPPGAGQRRGAVVRQLLELAGVEQVAIGGDGTENMMQPVELRDEQCLPLAREILSAEGMLLRADPDGFARAIPRRPETSAASWTFDARTVIDITDAPNSDGPTSVLAIGHEQILREDMGVHNVGFVDEAFGPYALLGAGRLRNRTVPKQGGGPTGSPPPRFGTITMSAHSSGAAPGSTNHGRFQAPYAPQVAGHQETGGTGGGGTVLTGLSTPPAEDRLVSRLVHVETYDGDALLSERTETFAWHNPEAAIGEIDDTAGSVDRHAGVYYYELGGTGYLWRSERFVKVSEETIVYVYDDDGFLVREIRERYGYYNPRRAVKDRANGSTDWGVVDYNIGVDVLANGDGVVGRFEQYRLLERGTTTYEPTPDGYLGRQVEVVEAWFNPPGITHLFNDGAEGGDDDQVFGVWRTHTTEHQAAKQDQVLTVRTERDERGAIIRVRTERRHGYLPAAPLRPDAFPPGLFDSPEEAAYAAGVSLYESREISAEVTSGELEASGRPQWQDRVEFPWAESADELAERGLEYLRDQSAIPFSVTVPANYLLRPGQATEIDLAFLGVSAPLDYRPTNVRVSRVRHEETPEATLTTVGVLADVF